ncbi:ATPase, partial [Gorgonomyces haynaldii]
MTLFHDRFMSGPIHLYKQLVAGKKLLYDNHQFKTAELLQQLYTNLVNHKPKKSWSFFKQPTQKGLYIYGDVGTGKSLVMDLFYNSMPIKEKRRVHFHDFMQDVHRRIHTQKSLGKDPIPAVAQDLTRNAWLLCFDELQVTDIADAMILRQLFTQLFDQGVVMVTTSNRHPDELYKNGIQRQSFLPCIQLIKDKLDIHSLNSGTDYRQRAQEQVPVFFKPHQAKLLQEIFNRLVPHPEPKTLEFWGRKLSFENTGNRVLYCTFEQVCSHALSAADYLEMTKHFDTFIIQNVPRMGWAQRNEARRFITLVDNLYDQKKKLIASFETELQDLLAGDDILQTGKASVHHSDDTGGIKHFHSSLFTGEEEVFAFQRAVSRLIEMQGIQWVGEDLTDLVKSVH